MEREDIFVQPGVTIPRREIGFDFDRSTGPGGQNVNKVNSRATLFFHIASSCALTPWMKDRACRSLASRIDKDGYLRISSQAHRTQLANRTATEKLLADLLAHALRPRIKRIPTKPSRGSKTRRLEAKGRVSDIKRARREIV